MAAAGAIAGSRTGRRLVGGAALVGVLGLIGVAGMFSVLVGSSTSDTATGTAGPSTVALADIPTPMLALYQQAGQDTGIDWAILAAIGSIESDHDRSTKAGVHSGVNFAGCCAGPMQFSVTGARGGTWGAYGVDGNHDGQSNVYDPADAIPAAAKYLKASGAPGDYHRALLAYNQAEWYVAKVEKLAATYRGAMTQAGGPIVGTGTVASVVTAAAQLDAMHVPYNYGGGHVNPATPSPGQDGPFDGLDCSSAVSWVLQHAGINVPTMASTEWMSWGAPGPGTVTVYASTFHAFLSVTVNGQRRYFSTSQHAGRDGPAWVPGALPATYLDLFVMRHVPGL
jgi:hypothetical protein